MAIIIQDRVETLSTGYRVKLSRPPAFVIAKAQTSIKLPEPPTFLDPETGKKHVNPLDPSYVAQIERAQLEGQQRAMFAVVLHGMHLVNEAGEEIHAPNDGWEELLLFSGIDWLAEAKEIVPKFGPDYPQYERVRDSIFLMYIALAGREDLDLIARLMGASDDEEGGVDDAAAAFQR